MIKKIKEWWAWNGFRIISGKRLFSMLAKLQASSQSVDRHFNWITISPVISDLERLRADTWNQDKITKIQKYLRDNFKDIYKDLEE